MLSMNLPWPNRLPDLISCIRCGALDILSIPPATTISASPLLTAWSASMTAFKPEPHILFMVKDSTELEQPLFNVACLAGACP